MAITKIKPIRGTVNKALAYILDPQKTDDQLYVSSYGCAASDAAAKEFEWTRNLAAQQGMQMPKVIARHLIQSFAVDEVTPEQAHEIGKQFADEWLKGKYEYVIATHIDKGHCHNHIIFNAVNYVDFHAYRSNKKTYREMPHLTSISIPISSRPDGRNIPLREILLRQISTTFAAESTPQDTSMRTMLQS